MLKKLDDWLNSFTMYRLVLYCLGVLAGVALLLSATDTLHYSLGSLAGSLVLITGLCFTVNLGLARLYQLPVNQESSLITGLILFFIMVPPTNRAGWLALVVAAVAAIASKYILTWRHASIFNPAAVGAVVVSLTDLGSAGWWIASKPLFIFCLLAGLLVIRKIRRFSLFFCFAVPAILLNLYWLMHGVDGVSLSSALQTAVMSYPVIFLGAFMLTEPSSMPQTHTKQLIFAGLVGILFASRIRVGDVSATPHLSLIVGNLFALLVSVRAAVRLKLVSKTELAPNIHDFGFEPQDKLHFTAGQYMEWTLPHVKVDSRGNRRTFTIASSPHESLVHLGLKSYAPASKFKDKLLAMKLGDTIEATHVAGDFMLPHSTTPKLVYIAGGIGVTPFRAMAGDMIYKQETRDVTLFYLAASEAEIVYKDAWQEAAQFGLKLVTLTGKNRLTLDLLKQNASDYKNLIYYISGPPPMVRTYKKLLKQAGVSTARIRTDYFSGY